MKNKFSVICLIILTVGIFFRLALTQNGNFIFNMDSARDFVDVREMVELKKLRLTGPTTPIDGLYDGPFWYYFLAIGYILSKGDPYSAVLMQIGLWAIGGFFLLKLVKHLSTLIIITVGLLWVASNYIVLANLYSFNPSPVTLLSPFFIYLLVKYLKENNGKYIILIWFLSGLFFNLEMNFGIFTPIIILSSMILTKNIKFIKQKLFWAGVTLFIFTLLPQVIFDLRHQFIMSKALFRHLSENSTPSLNLVERFQSVSLSFYNTFIPTLMNYKLLSWIILLLSVPLVVGFFKGRKKEEIILVSLIYISVPFLGYLILPVSVNPWHLGGPMAASIILIGFLLKKLWDLNLVGKLITLSLALSIFSLALLNIFNFFIYNRYIPNMDPSALKNEISAIDYVYKYANGKNFKVYSYLPSIYDYPYQYLFWWYGLKKYGYVPSEYAYSPNKPKYIPSQEKFQREKGDFSGLVFLIKEPDRNYTRSGWEGNFIKLQSIEKHMVGPIEIEVRRE